MKRHSVFMSRKTKLLSSIQSLPKSNSLFVSVNMILCIPYIWYWFSSLGNSKIASKDTIKRLKDNLQTGREYLQTMYLIRVSYPEYVKDSYKSITKRQTSLQIGKELEETLVQIRYSNSQ